MDSVSPKKTLAVILGASDWPLADFGGSPSFSNSAKAFRAYLLDDQGFNLPEAQLLDLFDDENPSSEMVVEIGRFLASHSRKDHYRDVLVYYVGHGFFNDSDNHYCLAARKSQTDYLGATSLRMADLALCLKNSARHLRRFLFLDSCFAGASVPNLQSEQVHVAVRKTARAFPSKGTLIYCASSKEDFAVAPPDQPYTMFSGAFIQSLRSGSAEMGSHLTMRDLEDLVWRSIRETFEEGYVVRPELHCPEKREGDLSEIHLFPNPAYQETPQWKGKSIFQFGNLSVSSSQGGVLFLDGKRVKRLEQFEIYVLEKLKAGNHRVRITADGFREVKEKILLHPNETQALDYDPKPIAPPPNQKEPTQTKISSTKLQTNTHNVGEVRTFHEGGLELEMVWCPSGTFLMGSPESEKERKDNETPHEVTLTKGFWLARTQVTQAQWKALMDGKNPSGFKGDKLPVETVSWEDVNAFIDKLNKKTSVKYRLPTEAEWEYACRAGAATPFHTGQNLTTDQANYDGNYPYAGFPKGEYREKTTAVGSFEPNAWGLYDMHGNVWEWCSDWYGPYLGKKETDPTGPPKGSYRVIRGGSWNFLARYCRSAFRDFWRPDGRGSDVGFRLLRTPE